MSASVGRDEQEERAHRRGDRQMPSDEHQLRRATHPSQQRNFIELVCDRVKTRRYPAEVPIEPDGSEHGDSQGDTCGDQSSVGSLDHEGVPGILDSVN
jgi:hypothetical protein